MNEPSAGRKERIALAGRGASLPLHGLLRRILLLLLGLLLLLLAAFRVGRRARDLLTGEPGSLERVWCTDVDVDPLRSGGERTIRVRNLTLRINRLVHVIGPATGG